jgi:hypothetical protein
MQVSEVYGAHGHHFSIDAPEPVAGRARRALQTLRNDHATPRGTYRVTAVDEGWSLAWNDEPLGSRSGPDSLLLLLHWHVNQRTIAASVMRRTTFHAAAARSPRGHGVLLAAPMESGKTTTVTGLLRAGWDFLTDEAAAVELDGTVLPYPKPLTIDHGSWPVFPDLDPGDVDPLALSWLVPAPATGSRVATSAPLRLIVFPAYTYSGPTRMTRVAPSAAALALVHSTFFFDQHGARDLSLAADLARRLPAFRLEIGDLAEAVRLIDDLDQTLEEAA